MYGTEPRCNAPHYNEHTFLVPWHFVISGTDTAQLSFFVSVFGGFNDTTVLYTKHSPRNFSPSMIGYFFAEVLFLKGLGIVLLIPLFTKILKWSDLSIAIIGAVTTVGFYVFLGFASASWMVFVGKYLEPLLLSPSSCIFMWYCLL